MIETTSMISDAPAEVASWRLGARRKIAVTLMAVVVAFAAAGWFAYACVEMPGESFAGAAPVLTASDRALAQELRRHVTELAVGIGERRATHGDSLLRAERYIQAELTARLPGARVRREALVGTEGNPANLVLELQGKRSAEIIVVGAHYDTAPGGTPGANDNGSGTAALLVLAPRLAQRERAASIRLVFFANEEPPHFQTKTMGSLQHAAGCAERGKEIRAMLSLETMGYYSDEPGSQEYPPAIAGMYPDRGNFIAFVGNVGSVMLVREVVALFREHASIASEGAGLPESLPGIGWSDHWSFWQHGYSAVMVTDTAVFRDPHYHEESDVVTNIDFEKLARVVVGLERTIDALANE